MGFTDVWSDWIDGGVTSTLPDKQTVAVVIMYVQPRLPNAP